MNRLLAKYPRVQSFLENRGISTAEILIIVGFAMVPIFFNFPYRVNIFLSWEGAYRLYLGQAPYKDFGIPMGYGYWIIPAMFFKVFGPFLSSLIKAQVFINIISGLSFRSIFKTLKVNEGIRLLSVLVFCLSYSFFNFWPWYNHTVIVYELVALSFALMYIFSESKYRLAALYLASLFSFLSVFTKQDGGGMAFMIVGILILVDAIYQRKIKSVLFFALFFVVNGCLFILPFINHDFGYWFNFGQPPHNSRISLDDFIQIIMGESRWEKFYLLLVVLIIIRYLKDWKAFLKDKYLVMFTLVTLGILGEALIFQVTSYTPPDNNIFFHSFAFVFIISNISLNIDFAKFKYMVAGGLLIALWWSGVYWKYVDRIVKRVLPQTEQSDEEKISVRTYVKRKNPNNIGMDKWVFAKGMKAFAKIYMPEPTAKGIEKLMNMEVVKNKKDLKVLNMTELTPLAYEMGYELEPGLPLWYHVGVGMFEKEEELFKQRIREGYYDIVLFEVIPYLNNFYPESVREVLKEHYEMEDRFLAPRRPTDSHIEVYVKE
ncbi:MAG: hypothetical protein AAFX87_12370 [Bacteroidota bacterium]